jgi:DNA polymerase-3 subunit alpha
VNYSGLDFEIQLRPPETQSLAHRDPGLGYPFPVPEGSAIRFGMAAIKNVGEGPVEAILAARNEGGPFTGLEEFCDRVDLRKVGKRPLEFLIKAGALDRFGYRAQLLAVLDLMVAQSTAVHDARDAGQLSMFDLMGGSGDAHVTPIRLPAIEEVKGKEKLAWEKELLGVYSISHPLMNLDVDLKRVVSCSCAELDERFNGKGVTLAGLISSIRTINTKKGDQMAFVQLEDLQGSCEVVFFPKAYAEYKDKLVPDAVVIVKGKAQTRESETSLLAEIVQTHFDKVTMIGEEPDRYQPSLMAAGPTLNGMALDEGYDGYANGGGAHANGGANGAELNGTVNGSLNGHANGSASYGTTDAWDDFGANGGYDDYTGGEESPFRNEIPDWLSGGAPPAPVIIDVPAVGSGGVNAAAGDEEDDAEGEAADITERGEVETVVPSPAVAAAPIELAPPEPVVVAVAETRAPVLAQVQNDEPADMAPQAPPPPDEQPQLPPAVAGDEKPVEKKRPPRAAQTETSKHQRQLVITFRRTGDLERDKYRLREIYDMVRDPRGRDTFVIRILSGSSAAELGFPNDGCTITDRLKTDLIKHFRVEAAVVE